MDIAVVGAGRAGTALAVLLARAGHRIVAVSGRMDTTERARTYLPGVPVLPAADAARQAKVIIIGTPDDRIGEMVWELASKGAVGPGQAVVHLSGAAPLAALGLAREAGATVLSLHPLQTLPDVASAIELLPGSGMAVSAEDEDGNSLGEALARDVGGRPFRLPDAGRPLYHAAAVFASNYVVALLGQAEELFGRVGLVDPLELFLPLSRASLRNAASLGPAAALTGPAARGDAGTLRRNLEALEEAAPEAVPAYVALADLAVALAERAGRFPAGARRDVEEVLARWR
jgi:predicted short-subunit dehydrogenase-like oxidoreductase (DUF2520 family)